MVLINDFNIITKNILLTEKYVNVMLVKRKNPESG